MSEISLAEFITLQRGFDLPSSNRKMGVVPVVASTGVSGYHNESKVKGPGVVIGRSGSIGGGQYIIEDFWPLNTTLWVKDFKGHPERFVYYLLKSIDFSRFNSGAAVPSLNRNLIAHVKVKNLGIENEEKVSQLLGAADDLINNNIEENRILESLGQAIFKSWFVDFDPVHAKKLALEKRLSPVQAERAAMAIISGVCNPSDFADNFEEMDKKLSAKLSKMSKEKQEELAHTASLFPSEFEDSELGEIPEEWKSSIISDEYSLTMGQSPKGDTYNENGNGTLFFQGRTDFGFRYPKPRVYTTDPKRMAQKGDTLISVRAPVGDKNLANEDCCIGRGLAALRHKTGLVSYTYYHISHIEGSLDDLGGSGTVFNAINKDTLSNIKIIAPTERLIIAFNKTVSSFDLLIGNNTTELETLEKLRDTLLPKLLSGEIDLSGVSID